MIGAILETYDGDPESAARKLVDAANEAGGKDNISAVFVAGPEFRGDESGALLEFQPRHVITRMREMQVLVLACGERTIRVRPALNVTPDELKVGVRALDDVLGRLAAAARNR